VTKYAPNRAVRDPIYRKKLLEELVSKPRWTGRSFERVPSPAAMEAAQALNNLPLPGGARDWRAIGDFDGGLYVTFCGGLEPYDALRWPVTATVHISRTGGYSVSMKGETGPTENISEVADPKTVQWLVGSFLFSRTPSCYRCDHLVRPGRETPNGKYGCEARALGSRLKTFPFAATKCQRYEPSEDVGLEYLEFLAKNTGNTTS
jgi:hypothetical protein